ncbi:MAG: 4-hydroxy-tetrahydrodipicolinate reductase [Acidiferrobacterales bacterium]|nr:4-hydroxy-tetrahydrodipicolinate reductase [Acidiferrobacterales bacterium]
MIKLAIAGASGRMGQALIRMATEDPELQVTTAFEYAGSEAVGKDAGLLAGIGELGVIISGGPQWDKADVVIDFTSPAASVEHAALCAEMGKPLLIGTTGMNAEQKLSVTESAKMTPIVLAANTSVGVNLCVALLETASRVIGDVTDIEVIESHHKHKVDAPSGTALLLGEAAARPIGKSLDKDGVFARHGITGARPEGCIGFSTIRGGDIAGEHTVMFIGESERLEITHRATDRKIFAKGALRAARWLVGQSPGFYDMRDVLALH